MTDDEKAAEAYDERNICECGQMYNLHNPAFCTKKTIIEAVKIHVAKAKVSNEFSLAREKEKSFLAGIAYARAKFVAVTKDYEDDWKRIQNAERECDRLREALSALGHEVGNG